MSNHITLYRGDYNEIEKFKYRKTDRFCLLGKGIYLTDDIKLAEDYRSKGAPTAKKIDKSNFDIPTTLNEGYFIDRSEAYEKAFDRFCLDQHLLEFGNCCHKPKESEKKIYKKYCEGKRQLYNQKIEEGEIYSVYHSHLVVNGKRYIVVRYKAKQNINIGEQLGYISEFSFDKDYLFRNIIDADSRYNDSELWKILYNAGITIGHIPSFVDERTYASFNTNRISLLEAVDKTIADKKAGFFSSDRATIFKRIEEALSPYGVIGYRYNGGARTGGKRHNAFCIWDEDFVNKHKVATYK